MYWSIFCFIYSTLLDFINTFHAFTLDLAYKYNQFYIYTRAIKRFVSSQSLKTLTSTRHANEIECKQHERFVRVVCVCVCMNTVNTMNQIEWNRFKCKKTLPDLVVHIEFRRYQFELFVHWATATEKKLHSESFLFKLWSSSFMHLSCSLVRSVSAYKSVCMCAKCAWVSSQHALFIHNWIFN